MRSHFRTPPAIPPPSRPGTPWLPGVFLFWLTAVVFMQTAAACAETGSLPFQSINVPPEVGLRSLPEEDVHYHGALYDRDAFLELWNLQENVMSDFPRLLNWLIPDPPPVDFDRYTVLWFSNRGAGASFVEMQRVVVSEDGGALEAHIKVVYSDFSSKKLNLWKIPKTHLPVVFREQAVFDGGP